VHQALAVDAGLQQPFDDEFALNTVAFYATLDMADLLLKFVKEYSAYCACRGLGQTETNLKSCLALAVKASELGITLPAPGCLARGWVRERSRWIMAPREGGSQQFLLRVALSALDVLYTKRGVPPAEPWMIEASVEEHRANLTTLRQDRPARDGADSPQFLREEIKLALRGLCRQVFGRRRRDGEYDRRNVSPEAVMPNTNACFERSRGSGGGLMEITLDCATSRALDRLAPEPENTKDSLRLGFPELTGMYWDPAVGTFEIHRSVAIQANLEDYLQRVQERSASYSRVDVTPSAIVEPCKVRMITKGPSDTYNLALSLQKILWGRMRHETIFQWIGKPVRPEDWDLAYPPEQIAHLVALGYWLVSGDYKGATDNLNPDLSEEAWRCVVENLEIEGRPMEFTKWYEIGRECLTRHRLHYEATSHENEVIADQRWGQLMGSPLSFPILNLVNAAAAVVGLGWRSALGEDPLSFAHGYGVHTNGDDISFVCPKAQYEAWKDAVTAAGLEPSLGKNYVSDRFLIINSETRFLLHEALEGGEEGVAEKRWFWEFKTFCNLPLLFGLEAKGKNAGESILPRLAYFDLGTRARALAYSCEPEVARRRVAAFVEYHRTVLSRAPAGCMWEVPEVLGGLGLPEFRIFDPPDSVRLNCAYLACLDTKTRLTLLTPPPRKPIKPWEKLQKHAGALGQRHLQRVSNRTTRDQDFLAERFKGSITKTFGGGGATLANWVDAWSNLSLRQPIESWQDVDERSYPPGFGWEDLDYVEHPEEFRKDMRPSWARREDFDDRMDLLRREKKFSARLFAMSRRALASQLSLTPMSVETIRDWNDFRTLEEVSFAPSYDTRWSANQPRSTS